MFLLLLPILIALVPLVIANGILDMHQWNEKRKRRRSPLSGKLLRSPGESLRAQLDEIQINLNAEIFIITLLPSVAFSFYLINSQIAKGIGRTINLPFSIVLIVAIIIRGYIKISKILKDKDQFRLGYECELATGQELNQLLTKGCRVFHDIVADNFNIDHVVVGKAGVFAIETKGRRKPVTGSGDKDAHVVYDGKTLQFPGWYETKPIKQSERQSAWLAKQLSDATGDKVYVTPVVALPGWFVENKVSSAKVLVINPKNSHYLNQLPNPTDSPVLSSQRIKQIVYQLERMCRDVEIVEKTKSNEKFAS